MKDSEIKLLFVCPWEKNRKKSWSGTHKSIFDALQHYFFIEDIDIGRNNGDIYNFFDFLIRAFKKALNLDKDMELNRIKHYNKVIKAKKKEGEFISLQFAECPLQDNIKSYYYQDLSVSAINILRNNDPQLFKFSGFAKTSIPSLKERLLLQNKAYEKSAGIFCMGEWFRKFLISSGIPTNKVYTVGAGINLDKSKIDITHKKGNKILFVGRDFIRKNGPLVIDAFKIAKHLRNDIELYIAGPTPGEQLEGVHWLGDVSIDDLSYYFNLCDIFCMPSKFEAYGIVFIEALTYGLPCIGRDAFEMPYFIEDGQTGYLLKNEDATELAKLMVELLGNETIKQNVLAKQQEYIDKYSWDAVAKRMANVIYSDLQLKVE